MKLQYLLPAVFALLVLTTCEKPERNNPFDEFNTLNPIDWTPSNLQIEDVSITEKRLNWSYGDHNIEGFKIDRKKGNDPWQQAHATLPKEGRSWNDTVITPDPSLEYSYRLYAFAGKINSTQQTSSSSAAIPPPTNLNLEKLSDVSYKLTWADKSIGEEGFRIDRKTGTYDWDIAYGEVEANQTEFVDENVFTQKKSTLDVQYSVYAWYGGYESEKAYVDTEARIPAPTNLQIEVNSITTVTLTWEDNSDGEEGFKIDRKVGEGEWQVEFAVVSNNQIYFTDNNVSLADNIYSYRVYAYTGTRNSTYTGATIQFMTPTATTTRITNITETSATGGGNVISDGGPPVTLRGIVWSTSEHLALEQNQGYTEDGGGTGEFTSHLTGLSHGTIYYVRAYATNIAGTVYGDQIEFTTSLPEDGTTGSVSDIDGNDYRTVWIGGREWMAENLRVTRYRNGSSIPIGLGWEITSGAYVIFPHHYISGLNSDADVLEAYGALYNWYAVIDSRGLCPADWSVPNGADWDQLVDYLLDEYDLTNESGDINGVGNKLKSCRMVDSPLGGECATSEHPRWSSLSTHYGSDVFGFSALPGGFWDDYITFDWLGGRGFWWSSTEASTSDAFYRDMGYNYGNVFPGYHYKVNGLSVRCVRDFD